MDREVMTEVAEWSLQKGKLTSSELIHPRKTFQGSELGGVRYRGGCD